MTAGAPVFATPLTPQHARQLDVLLETLSREEALWISGYLAGFARRAPKVPAPITPAAPVLTILYGSETGHAAALAQRMGGLAHAKGLDARVIDMADFRPQELKAARHLAIVTSTYGDGDPPDHAAAFHEFLHGRKAPRLEGAKFAVLGLGDSSYEHFCQTGKDFDRRLEALGARRIHPRADCDVDYEEPAATWIEAALTAFVQETKGAEAVATVAPTAMVDAVLSPAGPTAPCFDMRAPFSAPIVETRVLNGRGSDKETRHVELSLEGSDLAYEPGDSLAIIAENDPAVVGDLIGALGLDSDEPVPAGGAELPLAQALARHYEVTTLTPRFVESWAEAAKADDLRALAKPENRSALMAWLAGRQIIDVVTEFPAKVLAAQTFIAMLRKLQPRLYSLASSLAALPGEAHLTVAVVRYHSHGRKRSGVASAWLAERGIDDTVPVFVQRNDNFRLPADGATPVIMVGAGTGIAPFRAFLQEREAAGAGGRNWLFFGDRRFRTDFLYQVEWQRLVKDGRLTRMDVAFSRDQDEKVYVQHRLIERGREIFRWLEDGAHFYVCGDAAGLAPGIHAALVAIVERESGRGREQAEEYVKRLQSERRYQRDVY